MEKKIQSMYNVFEKRHFRNKQHCFKKIFLKSHLRAHEKRLQQEQEKVKQELMLTLNQKDKDLQIHQKKNEDFNGQIFLLKSKEQEFQNKLKFKEKQIISIEQEIQDIQKNKKVFIETNQTPSSQSNKLLEQKIAQLEHENNELREKQLLSETNVSLFIKDMSELLDSYEQSTNLGSDDNISLLNNSSNQVYEYQDEYDQQGILLNNESNKNNNNNKINMQNIKQLNINNNKNSQKPVQNQQPIEQYENQKLNQKNKNSFNTNQLLTDN